MYTHIYVYIYIYTYMKAAEEDCEALDYIYPKNEEGVLCMGVEYLLDRTHYRPMIGML
jgi:hypothetical protein